MWSPGAVVLPVVGCHGSAGASTVALAVATATGGPVRVVEAAGAGGSGLAGAATAELGPTGTGWVRGRRDLAVLDRLHQGYATPAQVPVPDAYPDPVPGGERGAGPVPVVLDVGWAQRTARRLPHHLPHLRRRHHRRDRAPRRRLPYRPR